MSATVIASDREAAALAHPRKFASYDDVQYWGTGKEIEAVDHLAQAFADYRERVAGTLPPYWAEIAILIIASAGGEVQITDDAMLHLKQTLLERSTDPRTGLPVYRTKTA